MRDKVRSKNIEMKVLKREREREREREMISIVTTKSRRVELLVPLRKTHCNNISLGTNF